MNSIYQEFNHNNNDITQVVQHFRQFKREMQGKNPQEEVMKYLQSGMINQHQLNQFQNMANQLTGLLN